MGHQHNEHLTIEQLSAFLDGQLPPEERAECDAHIGSCEQCKGLLADLEQTVILLKALPEPELPRSFVLPTRATLTAERSERRVAAVTSMARGSRAQQSGLWRTMRVLSTIAAVLGIFFIVSGLITVLPHLTVGAPTAASAPAPSFGSASQVNEMQTATPSTLQAVSQSATVNAAATPSHVPSSTVDRGPGKKPTPAPAATAITEPNPAPQSPLAQLEPGLLYLVSPQGLAETGFILLALGMLGVILTGRRSVRSG